ncbi:hypothetical protein TWF730_008403 [Orbilia blumenaviensis]|uniref:Uncharacterized protein n=1 Tax=Orbilia blumenaviensis TaxID=1796055 RepID=A0AAV9V630_9PEZI
MALPRLKDLEDAPDPKKGIGSISFEAFFLRYSAWLVNDDGVHRHTSSAYREFEFIIALMMWELSRVVAVGCILNALGCQWCGAPLTITNSHLDYEPGKEPSMSHVRWLRVCRLCKFGLIAASDRLDSLTGLDAYGIRWKLTMDVPTRQYRAMVLWEYLYLRKKIKSKAVEALDSPAPRTLDGRDGRVTPYDPVMRKIFAKQLQQLYPANGIDWDILLNPDEAIVRNFVKTNILIIEAIPYKIHASVVEEFCEATKLNLTGPCFFKGGIQSLHLDHDRHLFLPRGLIGDLDFILPSLFHNTPALYEFMKAGEWALPEKWQKATWRDAVIRYVRRREDLVRKVRYHCKGSYNSRYESWTDEQWGFEPGSFDKYEGRPLDITKDDVYMTAQDAVDTLDDIYPGMEMYETSFNEWPKQLKILLRQTLRESVHQIIGKKSDTGGSKTLLDVRDSADEGVPPDSNYSTDDEALMDENYDSPDEKADYSSNNDLTEEERTRFARLLRIDDDGWRKIHGLRP